MWKCVCVCVCVCALACACVKPARTCPVAEEAEVCGLVHGSILRLEEGGPAEM